MWATWEGGILPHIPSFVSHTRSVFTLLNTYFILSLLLLPPSLFFFLSLPLLLFLLPLAVLLSLAVHHLHLVGIYIVRRERLEAIAKASGWYRESVLQCTDEAKLANIPR